MTHYDKYIKLRVLLNKSYIKDIVEIDNYDIMVRKFNKKVFVLGTMKFLNYLFNTYN